MKIHRIELIHNCSIDSRKLKWCVQVKVLRNNNIIVNKILRHCHIWLSYFQSQFNQISFSIIGDDTAPEYFEVFGSSFTSLNQGEVRVRANLANDNRDRYYVSIIVISVLI